MSNFRVGPPQIDPQEIQLGEKIGEGCFGTVYHGRCRATDVAIKVPKKQDMTPEQLEAFIKEVEIMSNIYAPNINLFMGACTIPGKIMIVTEFLDGDMESILRNPNYPLSLYDRMKMSKDAAQGVAWLHGANPIIIHRDLKTSNLLFDKNKRIKVCDFGFSQLFQRGKKMVDEEGAKGTPLYMAPEVMLGDSFNEKADVYSFGIVLWECLSRSEPFSHHSDFDTFVDAVCNREERPPLPNDCLSSLKRLITQCWSGNSQSRPSFPAIVDALDNIIIDCAIEDEMGRAIWKNYFYRKEEVMWLDEFIPVVAQFMGITLTNPQVNEAQYFKEIDLLDDKPEWRCLKAVLDCKAKDEVSMVNIEKFGQVLNWFGPFKDADGKFRLLERVHSVLCCPWFFGPVEYDWAVGQLDNKPAGTFLVRFSSKDNPGCFAISKRNQNGKTIHHRIQHKAGSPFTVVNGKSYTSLTELVTLGKDDLKLLTPLPGSPYLQIFVQKNKAKGRIYDDDDDDE